MYTLKKLVKWLNAIVPFCRYFLPDGQEPKEQSLIATPLLHPEDLTEDKTPPTSSFAGKPVLHLIYPNGITRDWLRQNLEDFFDVRTSNDALNGFTNSIYLQPDLIICSTDLSEIPGLELSRKLKSASRTRHIPVIVLAEKSSEEEKLSAFKHGVDDFFTGPVSSPILKTKAKNLVEFKRSVLQHLSRGPEPTTAPDSHFLKKATEIVNQHLGDSDFETNDFAREAGLSRAQLYRKLHLCSGKSVKEFIRVIRLEKAASLLLEKHHNISEVAFKTGFNSPSYFTKSFTEHFGLPPRQFIKQNNPNDFT